MIPVRLEGESLLIDEMWRVESIDLIVLAMSRKPVPVHVFGEEVGTAQCKGNLIHITADGHRIVMGRKCLMGIMASRIMGAWAQLVPDGVSA